jgi:predicted alpha/beta hydrolase
MTVASTLPETSADSRPGEAIQFSALDGHKLGGVHFSPPLDPKPKLAAVFASGGGIRASVYRRFAAYLAANGVPVLIFDYRGIGASRPPRLRGFVATAEDWSELDCGGAIAWMRMRYPEAKLVALAHSIGTLLIGGAPNVGEVTRFVFIGAHTGYFGDYRRGRRLPMAMMWHAVMPLLTHIFGYFPARRLGLGEDIPAGMALQWAARRTAEFKPEATDPNATRARAMLARYAFIDAPTLALTFTDDPFATEKGCTRLLATYPLVVAQRKIVAPEFAGFSPIGHFGFFRRSAETHLWPIALAFLREAEPPKRGYARLA